MIGRKEKKRNIKNYPRTPWLLHGFREGWSLSSYLRLFGVGSFNLIQICFNLPSYIIWNDEYGSSSWKFVKVDFIHDSGLFFGSYLLGHEVFTDTKCLGWYLLKFGRFIFENFGSKVGKQLWHALWRPSYKSPSGKSLFVRC